MKHTAFRIIVFLLIGGAGFGLGCCKKPDNKPSNNGTLVLKFHITSGGKPFALNKTIVNTNGQHYNFSIFGFYASDVILTGTNPQAIAPILLVDPDINDIAVNPGQVDTLFTLSVPAGTYTGLQFGIGPDKQQNHMGDQINATNSYPANSALGNAFVSTFYWSGDLGYLFFTAQGKYDTTLNNSGSLTGDIQYHCGLDSNYSLATLKSPIQVTVGATTTFTINLETNDIFNTPNSIDVKKYNITHTTDSPVLAKQLLQNLQTALKTN